MFYRQVPSRDIATFIAHFRRRRPDVVHTHAALSARMAARLCGVPRLLSSRHCATGDARPAAPWRAALYNACTTCTVATAEAARRELLLEGVRAERIVTIQNGIPDVPRLSERERTELRHALDFPTDATVVGMCARLHDVKGHDLLLRAAAELLPHFPHLRLLFVGDGPARPTLELLAARLALGRAVRFVGFRADAYRYQNLFDINVNASRGTETSCLATSECMALGIPTVSSDFGGNPEMIREGENGCLFRSDDARSLSRVLAQLLRAPSAISRMREACRIRYLSDFSLPVMARRYRALYFGA